MGVSNLPVHQIKRIFLCGLGFFLFDCRQNGGSEDSGRWAFTWRIIPVSQWLTTPIYKPSMFCWMCFCWIFVGRFFKALPTRRAVAVLTMVEVKSWTVALARGNAREHIWCWRRARPRGFFWMEKMGWVFWKLKKEHTEIQRTLWPCKGVIFFFLGHSSLSWGCFGGWRFKRLVRRLWRDHFGLYQTLRDFGR